MSRNSHRDNIIFVDPDENENDYWWPALIVPPEDYKTFQRAMEIPKIKVSAEEHLVCYFEDGSYSVVDKKDVCSFDLKSSYFSKHKKDASVQKALKYYNSAIPPDTFKWLGNRGIPMTKKQKIFHLYHTNTHTEANTAHISTNK